MHQIDNAWAIAAQPAPQPVGTPGWFQGGDDTINLLATVVDYDWANTVQAEIINVVHNAGLVLDKTNDTQLLQSIIAIIQREATADLSAYLPLAGGTLAGPGNLIVDGTFAAGAAIASPSSIAVSPSGNVLISTTEPSGPFGPFALFAPYVSSFISSLNSYVIGTDSYRYWTGDPILSLGYDLTTQEYRFVTSASGAAGAVVTNISGLMSFPVTTRDVRIYNQLEIVGNGVIYSALNPSPVALGWIAGNHLDLYVATQRQGTFQLAAVADDDAALLPTMGVDALAEIQAIGLGSFQMAGKTVPLGLLSQDSLTVCAPAYLVRAIQQLSDRVVALEGAA
jgi:hypothetical protein